jgi:hypothetical protein
MFLSDFATVALALALLSATMPAAADTTATADDATVQCTQTGDGYLNAKIAGVLQAEIAWGDRGTACTGEARPQGGVRFSFKNRIALDQMLLIVFGIPGVQEGRPGRALPANVTVVREGAAEFYSTRGEDKCTVDRLDQVPVKGPPHKQRIYRVTVRGFCTEPARAVNGEGAVLLSRFDFASELRIDEEQADTPDPPSTVALRSHNRG